VSIRLGAVLSVCSAGEITNVTQPFQPAGRFWNNNNGILYYRRTKMPMA
jgi:hypothetical protein